MERVVIYISGFWFWLTRRWRIAVYSEAAATLELAHAYLVRDFASRASTRDRGLLLPQQDEALSILQKHAVETYVTAARFAKLGYCCHYVGEELRRLKVPAVVRATRPAPVVLRPAPETQYIRIRFAPNRVLRFSFSGSGHLASFARFLRAETLRTMWDRRFIGSWRLRSVVNPTLTPKPAEQPLKAA